MLKSGRAVRKSKIMTMKANPPSLVPPVRQTSYMDYDSLSSGDKAKCKKLIDQFQRTGQITCPTAIMYQKILCVLREERRIFSSDGNFVKAGELDTIMRELSQFYHENKLYKAKAEEVQIAENQLRITQGNYAEAKNKWEKEIAKQEQQRTRAIERVDEFCDQRMNEYDTKIPDLLPASHSKLSPELLNIKDRERHMIGCRMFKEAEALHKEFEKRQKEELQRRRYEYYQSFEIERKELEGRTNRKRTAARSDWERKINHTQHIANKETKPLGSACGYLERKLVDAKAEYIGEDDPIINDEKEIYESTRFRGYKPILSRTITPRTLLSSTKSISAPSTLITTKRMSSTLQKQNRNLDSVRWPR